MGKIQMDKNTLTVGGIIGMGVLATSLVLGAEIPTYATMFETAQCADTERHYRTILEVHHGYLVDTTFLSLKYDQIKIGMDNEEEEEDWPEIEVIENPVVKRIVFQFKKPVRMEFS